jgi:hypothetical protein
LFSHPTTYKCSLVVSVCGANSSFKKCLSVHACNTNWKVTKLQVI